jgi:HEAT repeat protein
MLPAWVPFQGQTTDSIPGLITPAQKRLQYKKMRLDASEANPEMKQQIVEYLTKTIRTEADAELRADIIKTLAEYPLPSAEPVLEKALQDPDADVRIAACEAWKKLPNAHAADLLVGVLKNDANRDVRLAAARGLGQTKDKRAIDALGDVLADNDPAMQHRAVLSLQSITGREDIGNSIDRWQKFVKEENPQPAEPVSIADKFKIRF